MDLQKSYRRSHKPGELAKQYSYSDCADMKPYFIRFLTYDAARFRRMIDHILKITLQGADAIKRDAKRWAFPEPYELLIK